MRRATAITIFLLIIGFTAFHVTEEAAAQAGKAAAAWTTVFDGKNLSAFNMIGERELALDRRRRSGEQRQRLSRDEDFLYRL